MTNSFTFDWQRGEHARVTSLLVRELFSTGFRRVLKWVVVAILALELMFIVTMTILGEYESALRLGPWIVLVGVLVWRFYSITGHIRAWQLQHADPNVKHPITHTLDVEGYHISTHTADIELKWDGLFKVRETPDYFLVYYSRRYAYYLPKRILASGAAIDDLRARIRTHLSDSVAFEQG